MRGVVEQLRPDGDPPGLAPRQLVGPHRSCLPATSDTRGLRRRRTGQGRLARRRHHHPPSAASDQQPTTTATTATGDPEVGAVAGCAATVAVGGAAVVAGEDVTPDDADEDADADGSEDEDAGAVDVGAVGVGLWPAAS